MAVERIAEFARSGLPWAVSADILNCFDTIPRQPLLAGVKKSVTADGKVLQLIQRWIETTAVPKTRARHTGIGIPQGAVLSPFLCNVYLTAFDNSLAAKRIRFVRFADNVFALAGSREGAAEIRKRLAQELHRLGMELNQAKTKIVRYGPEVKFLGRSLPHLGRRERACIRENRW
jgi:RNA-directed DNA polymerase